MLILSEREREETPRIGWPRRLGHGLPSKESRHETKRRKRGEVLGFYKERGILGKLGFLGEQVDT